LESTNLSVGRGTDTPFEVLGAPYIDAPELAAKLFARGVPGLVFEPTSFTPTAAPHRGALCHGLRMRVRDRAAFAPVTTALTIASVLAQLYPSDWDVDHMDRMLRNQLALGALKAGKSVADIEATWSPPLADFLKRREPQLLY
jgi:uncharacterized protein YbbC (DUF1343 family)